MFQVLQYASCLHYLRPSLREVGHSLFALSFKLISRKFWNYTLDRKMEVLLVRFAGCFIHLVLIYKFCLATHLVRGLLEFIQSLTYESAEIEDFDVVDFQTSIVPLPPGLLLTAQTFKTTYIMLLLIHSYLSPPPLLCRW